MGAANESVAEIKSAHHLLIPPCRGPTTHTHLPFPKEKQGTGSLLIPTGLRFFPPLRTRINALPPVHMNSRTKVYHKPALFSLQGEWGSSTHVQSRVGFGATWVMQVGSSAGLRRSRSCVGTQSLGSRPVAAGRESWIRLG